MMESKILIIYGIIFLVIVLLVVGFKFLKKRIAKKMDTQKEMVNQHKQTVSIFVISKKKGKISEARLPKAVMEQVPKIYKVKKMPLITAKVGPQIVTLLSEEDIYKKIPEKKNITIELAGIFIVGIKNKKK